MISLNFFLCLHSSDHQVTKLTPWLSGFLYIVVCIFEHTKPTREWVVYLGYNRARHFTNMCICRVSPAHGESLWVREEKHPPFLASVKLILRSILVTTAVWLPLFSKLKMTSQSTLELLPWNLLLIYRPRQFVAQFSIESTCFQQGNKIKTNKEL